MHCIAASPARSWRHGQHRWAGRGTCPLLLWLHSAHTTRGIGLCWLQVAVSQQTRHARRLYVGGLGDVSEAEIADYFNDLVRAVG
jgi:hypothetical protein